MPLGPRLTSPGGMHSESRPKETPHTFQLPVPIQQCSVGLVGLTEVGASLGCFNLPQIQRRFCSGRLEGGTGDCIGTSVEDAFLIGYGLDYNGRYRNLPYIGILSETLIEQNP